MKNAEEILKECSIELEYLKQESPMLTRNILIAMEQYAKETAIEFGGYIAQNLVYEPKGNKDLPRWFKEWHTKQKE